MIAYFNCFSGISGDMILGALVDAGVPLSEIRDELSRLPFKGYELKSGTVRRGGFRATKVKVVVTKDVKKRTWQDIAALVERSKLAGDVKADGLKIFRNLFSAEAKAHGRRPGNIHLHELGAVDCLVDVFGAVIGLKLLGADSVCASPLNLGSGTVKTDHGILPIPAPATARLVRGIPVYATDVLFELTTPTGAAIISTLSRDFGPVPDMSIDRIGVGAGQKDFTTHPNVLTLYAGEGRKPGASPGADVSGTSDYITVIETNIDDMNPQIYEHVLDELMAAGALDVFLTQIIMKKGRPGIKVTVLCRNDDRERLSDILLRETSSIGVRYYRSERHLLPRKKKRIHTRFGKVTVKVCRPDSAEGRISLEYEDCRKIAKKFKLPLLEVMKVIERGSKS